MYTLLPPWVQIGGIDAMISRLSQPDMRQKVQAELLCEAQDWDNLVASTGWSQVIIAGGQDESMVGESIADYAQRNQISGEEACIQLIVQNHGDIPIVFYSMDADDVAKVLTHPDAVIISDSLYSPHGLPHPRRYGAFGKAVREYAPILGFEKVIQSMTAKPAHIMGITDRGILQKGKKADILILQQNKLSDTATYTQPKSYPTGIQCVIINGILSIEHEKLHGYHGKVLTNR